MNTVHVEETPHSVAVARDGSRAYITHFRSGKVSVFDTATESVVDTFQLTPGLYGVAVSSDGQSFYVANPDSTFVKMVDSRSGDVQINAGIGSNAYGLASGQGFLYATAALDDAIVVLDGLVKNIASITGVDFPVAAAEDPAGDRLYVSNYFSRSVSVVDVAGLDAQPIGGAKIVAKIEVPIGPYGIAVHPDGTRVYVAHFPTDDLVSVIDTDSLTVVDSLHGGNGPIRGIALTPDGANIYVTNYFDSSLSIIPVS